MQNPEDTADLMQLVLDAASAHVFTEGELRTLAMLAINTATGAIDRREYSVAISAIDDALSHLRALREKKAG